MLPITKEQYDKMRSRIVSACSLTHCSICPIGRRENKKGKTAGWRCFNDVADYELVEKHRAKAKGGQEDLDKANWYMDKLMELEGAEK